MTSIDSSAFSGCTSLKYNEYDNGLYLGNKDNLYLAFIEPISVNISTINLNNNVQIFADSAFSGCTRLKYNKYDNGLYLGNKDNLYLAFIKPISVNISTINLNNNVRIIADSAFSWCGNLTHIELPNSVTSIGDSAFKYCTSLTEITIPNSVTSIGGAAFYYCTSLTEITIPYRVRSIGSSAFSGCTNLTSIEIPNSVTSIGNSAFYNCTSLTKITIPNSVTSIGNYAFKYCTSLTIYCEASSKPDGWKYVWNFDNCPVIWNYRKS